MEPKQQISIETKKTANTAESINIKPEVKFFIDTFCVATGKYPQYLTPFATTYIMQKILENENKEQILQNGLDLSAYDFKSYEYYKAYVERIYTAHQGAKIPDSIANDKHDQGNFRESILMNPLIKRIVSVKDLDSVIKILIKKGKITESSFLVALQQINQHIQEMSSSVKEYKEVEKKRSQNPGDQKLQDEAETLSNQIREEFFQKIYADIPEVKDRTLYSVLVRMFNEKFVEKTYALTETRNDLDALHNVNTRTTISNLCKKGDDEACILLKTWLEKEGVPELTFNETPELLAVLKRRGFEITTASNSQK